MNREARQQAQIAALQAEVARLRLIINPPSSLVLRIAEKVARRYHITAFDIMGRSRLGYICDARRHVMRVASRCGMSSAQIGKAMGRDHTTILHALGRLAKNKASF